jgi:hypothetical protein
MSDEKVGKPILASKTVRVGGLYLTLAGLVGILQGLDHLETALKAINLESLPPDIATWGGIVLAVIGTIQIWLRVVTKEPVIVGRQKEEKGAG